MSNPPTPEFPAGRPQMNRSSRSNSGERERKGPNLFAAPDAFEISR